MCIAASERSEKDLAVVSTDKQIRVWNMETGNRLFSIETNGQQINRMKWDADDPNKVRSHAHTQRHTHTHTRKHSLSLPLSL